MCLVHWVGADASVNSCKRVQRNGDTVGCLKLGTCGIHICLPYDNCGRGEYPVASAQSRFTGLC